MRMGAEAMVRCELSFSDRAEWRGALRECLRDPEVEQVVSVIRAPTGATLEKLREIMHKTFSRFHSHRKPADRAERLSLLSGRNLHWNDGRKLHAHHIRIYNRRGDNAS
jgi:hypothetical protein